tara:strand:+ start:11284 stop:11622 length:339 start_codon:yes stop_codon:yes gene_type:complete
MIRSILSSVVYLAKNDETFVKDAALSVATFPITANKLFWDHLDSITGSTERSKRVFRKVMSQASEKEMDNRFKEALNEKEYAEYEELRKTEPSFINVDLLNQLLNNNKELAK